MGYSAASEKSANGNKMTSRGGLILPFLFLFILLVNTVFAMDRTMIQVNSHAENGYYSFFIDAYQPECITTYGTADVRCAGSTRSSYMFLGGYNLTSGNPITGNTPSFSWTCYNNSKRCYSQFDLYTLQFNQSYPSDTNYTGWLSCDSVDLMFPVIDWHDLGAYYDCVAAFGSNFNWSAVATNGHGGVFLHDVGTGTEMAMGSSETQMCIANDNLVSSSWFSCTFADGCIRPNRAPGCVTCNSGEISCTVLGNSKSNGKSFLCDDSGFWKEYRLCVDGGWFDCGLNSALDCPGAFINITVANMNNEPERISLTDNVGRLLSWKGTNYEMFSGQTITRTRFKFVDRYTLNPWLLTGSDLVSIVHSWNATELTCTKDAGASSFSPGASVYVDNSDYNCVLEAGYTTSNLTITIQANLTSHGSIVPISTALTKTFIVQVISDMALLDNVQVLYVNSSHIAFSGHIIKYSDLTEIPESKNPYVFFNYTFFDNTSITTINGGGNTGKLNATDANYIYYLKASTGQETGSLVVFNATVGADGIIEEIYSSDSVYMSPVRLLFFKCKNVPKNTTLRTDINEPFYYSKAVEYECAYTLANPSDILLIDLVNKTHIYKSNDVAGSPDDPSQTFIEAWTLEFLGLSTYGSAVEVPFNKTIGNVVYNRLAEAVYTLLGENGAPSLLDSGRYVGRWSMIDNPIFYQVNTYVDLIIEEEPFGGFVFNDDFIYFNQTIYNQRDQVVCTATYFDTDGIVSGWSGTLSGDSGYSSTVYSNVAQTCNSTSPTQDICIVKDADCIGNTGDEYKQCSVYLGLAGIQSCIQSAPGTNVSLATTDCLAYKNQFFTGRGTKTLTCSVTLFKADGAGGEVTHSTTAKVIVTGKDFFGDIYSAWWFWPVIILLIIILLLMLKWKLRGSYRR